MVAGSSLLPECQSEASVDPSNTILQAGTSSTPINSQHYLSMRSAFLKLTALLCPVPCAGVVPKVEVGQRGISASGLEIEGGGDKAAMFYDYI